MQQIISTNYLEFRIFCTGNYYFLMRKTLTLLNKYKFKVMKLKDTLPDKIQIHTEIKYKKHQKRARERNKTFEAIIVCISFFKKLFIFIEFNSYFNEI